MRSASMRVKMALVLWCAGAGLMAGAVKAGPEAPVAATPVDISALPVNKWALVYDGPPRIIGVHARLLWLPAANQGFLWPDYHYRSKAYTFEQHAQVHFFSPDQSAWAARPSAFPENLKVYPEMVGRSYAYLEGIKRVLLLQPGGDFRRTRANTWLFDPQTLRWEALVGDLRMTDQSADFNPAAGRDGAPVPLYGALCYDGRNGEAVAVGGGGTWGRVGKEKEKVGFGDWVYDEAGSPKRIRRLTKADVGTVTKAPSGIRPTAAHGPSRRRPRRGARSLSRWRSSRPVASCPARPMTPRRRRSFSSAATTACGVSMTLGFTTAEAAPGARPSRLSLPRRAPPARWSISPSTRRYSSPVAMARVG